MRPKSVLLILYNSIIILPAILSLLLWLLLSVLAAFSSFLLLAFIGSIFLIYWSLVSAIRLKLRILKEIKDSSAKTIRRIYKSASRVNIGALLIVYPITFSLFSGNVVVLVLFLLIAVTVALPMRILVSIRKGQYKRMKEVMMLGMYYCARCDVSLGYSRKYRRWMCLGCGTYY